MSSNYVDTTATKPITGPCSCPGTPHDADTADVRVKLGYGEIAIYRQAGWIRSGDEVFSAEDAKMAALSLGIVRWNLVLPDGKPRPITSEQIALLDEDTVEWLWEALEPAIKRRPLPNGSGAPSSDGSQASAGSTPTSRAPTTSTTT